MMKRSQTTHNSFLIHTAAQSSPDMNERCRTHLNRAIIHETRISILVERDQLLKAYVIERMGA